MVLASLPTHAAEQKQPAAEEKLQAGATSEAEGSGTENQDLAPAFGKEVVEPIAVHVTEPIVKSRKRLRRQHERTVPDEQPGEEEEESENYDEEMVTRLENVLKGGQRDFLKLQENLKRSTSSLAPRSDSFVVAADDAFGSLFNDNYSCPNIIGNLDQSGARYRERGPAARQKPYPLQLAI